MTSGVESDLDDALTADQRALVEQSTVAIALSLCHQQTRLRGGSVTAGPKRQGWCPAPKFESFSVNGFDGRGSDLGQPTVDGKVRSSDEAALVAGQEQCRCGDFLWAGESAERNLVGQRRADVVG
jgi:hypothetical protein